MRRFLATLMTFVMLMSILPVTAMGADSGENATYTQPLSKVKKLVAGYAVLLRNAEICSDQQLKKPIGDAKKGDVVLAESRKDYGTAQDRVKISWACQDEIRTGWVAAKHLRLMDKSEVKAYEKAAKEKAQAVEHDGRFLLNIAAYQAAAKDTVARTDLPATTITSLKTTSKGMSIKWNAVEGAAKYQVYRSTKKSSGFKRIATVTTTGYVDDSAKRYTGYYYYIKTLDENGASSKSATKARYHDYGPAVKFSRSSSGTVKIYWAARKNAVNYALYRAEEGSSSYEKIATVSGTSYVDKKAENGKTYSYYLMAKYKVNGLSITGSQGNKNSYTYGVTKPASFAATNYASGVKLTWSAVDDATGYRLYYRVAGDESWTQLTTTKATAKSYTHKTPAYGKEIQYSIRTQGKLNGKNVYAPRVSLTHVAVGRAAATIKGNNGSVIVTWTDTKGATGYEVVVTAEDGTEYRADVSDKDALIASFRATATCEYSAVVTAYCELEGRRWYGRASATAKTEAEGIDPATIPVMTVKESTTANMLDISWQSVKNATGYVVFAEEAGQTQQKEYAAEATGGTIPVNEGTVKVRMRALFADGAGHDCDVQTVEADWADGIRLVKPAVTMVQGEAYKTAKLSWEAVADAEVYRLMVTQSSWHAQDEISGVSYDLTVNGNGVYQVHLRAETLLPSGEKIVGPWYKGNHSLTWPAAMVNKPTAAVKLSDKANYIDVSWNAVSGATKYGVQVYGEDNGWLLEETTTKTGLSIPVNGGETVKVYVWSVVDGEKSDAAELSINTRWSDMIAMEAPEVTCSLLDEPEMLVSWEPVAGASKYYLLVTTGGIGGGSYEAYGTSRKLAVSPEKAYQFNVVPVFDDGEGMAFLGPRSAFVDFFPEWGRLRLETPVVTADMTVPNVMTFRWNAVPDAVSYLVEFTRDGETRTYHTNQLFISEVTNGDGTEYTVAVRALAEDAETGLVVSSDYGTAWAAATWADGVNLIAPQVNVFANACDDERGLVETYVTWEPVKGADGYGLCSGDEGGPGVMKDVGDVTSVGLDLVKGKTYFFFLQPYFELDGVRVEGPIGEPVTFTALYGADTLTAPEVTLGMDEESHVQVSWKEVEHAFSYTITYGKVGEEPTQQYVEAFTGEAWDIPVTSWRFWGDLDATYEISVCANWEEDGIIDPGPASAKQTITVKEEKVVLTAPKMTVSTADRGWVTVSWKPVEGADKYRIYFKETTESAFMNGYVEGDVTSVKIPAANNTSYKVYMRAVHESDFTGKKTSGPSCSSKTVTTDWTTQLAAPKLTITKGEKGVLHFSCTEVKGADGYILYYRKSTETKYTKYFFNIAGLIKGEYQFSLEVIPETTYDICVRAFEGEAQLPYLGKKSTVHSYFATWVPVLAKPEMDVSQGSMYRMNIAWEPVEHATKYRIYYKKKGASGYTNTFVDGSETSYALKVENDTTYEVYMRAVHVDEDGTTTSGPKCSNQTIFVHWDEPIMDTPTLTVTPVAGDPGVTELEIAWTVPDDEWKYLLAHREEGDESFWLHDVTDKNGGPILWDAATGSVMEFRMEAYYPVDNESFWAEPTETITIKAAYGYYALVEPAMALTLGQQANELIVSWDEQAFATHYAVYHKAEDAAEFTRVEVPGNENSLTLPAEAETTYQVYVAAIFEENGVKQEGPACAAQSIYAYWAPEMTVPEMMLELAYNGKTTVIWNNVTGANAVEFRYRKVTDEDYEFEGVDLELWEGNSLWTVLEPETEYEGYLVARHMHRDQEYARQESEKQTFTTLGGPQLAVPMMTLTLGDRYDLNIAWESVEEATGYSLFYKTEDDADYTNVKLGSDVTSYRLTVQEDVKYDVYMLAFHVDEVVNVTTSGAECAVQTIKADWTSYRALLIGQTYPDDDPLPGPDVDARGMRTMLKTMTNTPYETTVKLNLSADGMKAAIASTFADATEDSVSLFYYSGHGMNNYGGTYQGALVGTGGTYLSVSELRAALDRIPGIKIVILDSCHSGAHIGKSVSTMSVVEKTDLSSFNNSVIMTFASRKKDVATDSNLATDSYYVLTASHSQENSLSMGIKDYRYVGVFTHALLYGSGYDEWNDKMLSRLRADANGDERISLQEAYTYAYEGVLKGVGDMSPSQNQHVQVYPTGSSFVLWEK